MIRISNAASRPTSSAVPGGSVSYSRTGSPPKSSCNPSLRKVSPNSITLPMFSVSRWLACLSKATRTIAVRRSGEMLPGRSPGRLTCATSSTPLAPRANLAIADCTAGSWIVPSGVWKTASSSEPDLAG